MESKETGCQPFEGPILCVNNCGFFGSAATMNMCSKCHKDHVLEQERAKLAASSIGNIVIGSSSNSPLEPTLVVPKKLDVDAVSVEPEAISDSSPNEGVEAMPKQGPRRCSTCRIRLGLTGFDCRCGQLFCATHRYSDKHDCPFDYRTAGRDAIAKANPVVKAEKLDKV